MGTKFFVNHKELSAVKRVQFVSNRMSYTVLRCCCCNIIVLNVLAPTEEKCDDLQDSFYEELEQVFSHFFNYHKKILLEDFNARLGRDRVS